MRRIETKYAEIPLSFPTIKSITKFRNEEESQTHFPDVLHASAIDLILLLKRCVVMSHHLKEL